MLRLIPVMLFFVLVLISSMAFAQDTIVIEGFWSFLEKALPAWVVIGLVVLRQVAEVIAKAIPDTATGGLATVRRIFKILAIYVPNRA